MTHWLSTLSRDRKRYALMVFDVIALLCIVWASFCVRFGTLFIPNSDQVLLILAAPIIAIPVYLRLGLYRAVLRYLPDKAIWTIVQAVTISVLIWVALAFLTRMTGAEGIPRTIPVVYWVLGMFVIAGSRFGMKYLLAIAPRDNLQRKRILIYGTGDAGVQLADALKSARDRYVAGFVTEDESLHGMDLLGIRVHKPGDLPRIVENYGIDEIVIAAPSMNVAARRELLARLSAFPVKARILPAITDLASGKYLVSHVRDIDIDDLLGRSQIPADPHILRSMIRDRVVLVTGAAGSIGSALVRTVAAQNPARLILMDINEHGLYQLGRELSVDAGFELVCILGSITDPLLVERTLAEHRVQNIYNCAAYKHVSLVEQNVIEGIRNNIFGAAVLAEAAARHGVDNFTQISSDKAVRPVSVMGATKRWSELVVRHFGAECSETGKPRNFVSVRFGNVIGSSGSVVPLFAEQIRAGGPVTLTDDNMTRYFMSVREASELIVQAGALSVGGDVLLLDMGDPIRIRDLAEDMIILAGLSVRDGDNPDGDIEIVTIGARDGEKLHEELFYDPASVTPTDHARIMRARSNILDPALVPRMLEELRAAVEAYDRSAARNVLFDYARQVMPQDA